MIKIIIAFAFGAISSYAMAPYNYWACLFLGLSALYVVIDRSPTVKKTALISFAFSLGYFGLSLSWVANALLVEGNAYAWAWPLAVCGLPLILSCFTAIFCAGYKIIFTNQKPVIKYLGFTCALLLAELARGNMFTGFPWNLYGYTWIDVKPIANVAHFYNIYCLTFLTILWAITPAFLAEKSVKKTSKIIITLIALGSYSVAYAYGTININSIKNKISDNTLITVAVIQPNIEQSEKWKPEKQRDNFLKLISLTQEAAEEKQSLKEAEINIIIWPETAIANNVLNSEWAKSQISSTLQTFTGDTVLITGALRQQEENQFYNSIVLLNKKADITAIYNKSHLVPFGEYMPLDKIINIAPIVGFQGFQKGTAPTLMSVNDTLNIFPLICYEVIFPNMISKNKENNKSTLIINVTNDAWYGNSAGPYQHLVQAQFRAIESGKTLIRSANTGISAIISPTGEIKRKINLQTSGKIVEQVLTTEYSSK